MTDIQTTGERGTLMQHLGCRRTGGKPGSSSSCQLLAVTSGKGGVGKTYVVVNLALALSRAGKRVAILDADYGLANVDVVLGLTPEYHLGHVLEGKKSLRSIIVTGPEGIHLIPASSGVQGLTEMGNHRLSLLWEEIADLRRDYDYILVDTAAGISDNVIGTLSLCDRVIVMLAPEPTAIVDAYALIKVLLRRNAPQEILLLVNAAEDAREAEGVHRQLACAVERFLGRQLGYLGCIPRDRKVAVSVRRQQPLLITHPKNLAARYVLRIADQLMKRDEAATGRARSMLEVN
ncbi:MAG: MinD/ParA family protein [Acidobacteriota bacterium]